MYGYDDCHVDDLGDWGKHIFVLIKETLENLNLGGIFNIL
jgi:hypothetical protein